MKRAGEQLYVTIQPPESSAMSFKPIILRFDGNKEFRWKRKLFIKDLFDGEHYFILADNLDRTSTLTHGEKFSGLLVILLGKTLENTKKVFVLMNELIKVKSEK